MGEYMTMIEAFECDDEDVPYLDGYFNWHDEHTKAKLNKIHCDIAVEAALSDKWQVKKADPKVLTAEEIEQVAMQCDKDKSGLREYGLHCARKGIENGQIKEWNRTKELRELLEKWSKMKWPSSNSLAETSSICNDLLSAIKNLKPPCQ